MLVFSTSSSRQKGFTLTELAIVMGVIGIIMGAIWVSAGQVNEKARVSQTVNVYGTITQNMSSLLQGGYGVNPTITSALDITTSMLPSGSGAIPQAAMTAGSPGNAWTPTGGLKIWWVGSSPRTYRLSFYGVTIDGCIGLIAQLTKCTPGQSSCPTNVVVGGTTGAFSAAPPGTALSTAGGLTTAAIQTLCSPGTNLNTYPGGGATANSVEFDFTQ